MTRKKKQPRGTKAPRVNARLAALSEEIADALKAILIINQIKS